LGTRGSELALWQARHVAERIAKLEGAPEIRLVPLRTAGDLQPEVALTAALGKAFFTGEIERALVAGEIDLAVHSLKDLPTASPPELAIAAVLARDDPRDALISARGGGAPATLAKLPAGARVGTSSPRRRAQLARLRPDLVATDLRGNVPTRLHKLDAGEYDALLLAAAGLRRLGLAGRIDELLAPECFYPAPGQGALAVQVRADDESTRFLVATLDDAGARAATTGERTVLGALEGGCQVPVGALGVVEGDRLRLAAIVAALDGREVVEGSLAGGVDEAAALGARLADDLLARGADAILRSIRDAAAGR
jgi:hydroxymethylbilane synthase